MNNITYFSDATASSSREDNFSVGSEEDQVDIGHFPLLAFLLGHILFPHNTFPRHVNGLDITM